MNNIIYQGSENVLILSRVYTTTWVCEFDLTMYPFDEQKCDMIFAEQVVLYEEIRVHHFTLFYSFTLLGK